MLAEALRHMVSNLRDMLTASRRGEQDALEQSERAAAAVREAEISRQEAESARQELSLIHI